MALNPDIVEAVANSNFKMMAEASILDATAHRNRLNILAEKSLSKSLEAMDTLSVSEGLGIAAAQRGDLAKIQVELGSVTAALQQMMKGAQTTPPVTP